MKQGFRLTSILGIGLLTALIAAADVALAQVESFDPGPEISPNAEQWRYSYQNGCWWYLSPERKWLYWFDGRWVEYLPPSRSNAPPNVQPPVPQRTARRRWFAPYSAWRYGPAALPYNAGPAYYGQMGYGVY